MASSEEEVLAGVSTLVFFVNGKKVVDNDVDPEWTLLYYLRNKLKLYGTKLGCAEGGCGACTVMLSKYDRKKKKVVHMAVNACLAAICSVHGCAITTVEGIGSTRTKLHPVQERLAKAHGSQCGFCTPGIVMSMYALLRANPKPKMVDMEIAFQGNLCRCTGYRPIIEGLRTFTEEWEQAQVRSKMNEHAGDGYGNGLVNGSGLTNGWGKGEKLVNGHSSEGSGCPMGKFCCKNSGNEYKEPEEILFNLNEFAPYDPSQEVIFPPELMLSSHLDEQKLVIRGPRTTWYRPTTFEEVLRLKKKFPQLKIINGNTEVGVEVKFKNFVYPVFVNPGQVEELTGIEFLESGIKFGAAVTLNEINDVLRHQIAIQPGLLHLEGSQIQDGGYPSATQLCCDSAACFHMNPPTNKSILKWYNDFVEKGCICNQRKGHSGAILDFTALYM